MSKISCMNVRSEKLMRRSIMYGKMITAKLFQSNEILLSLHASRLSVVQQSLEGPGSEAAGGSETGFGLMSSRIVIFVDRDERPLLPLACLSLLQNTNAHFP